MTGILGFADLLAAEVGEDQRPFVDFIERNGLRLLDTLNAVLDLSQLEAGEYRASVAPTRLERAVREAAARFEGPADDRGLRFDVEIDPDAAAAVDPTALSQIAGYLISNAVKFTDAGGVLVSVEATPDRAVLRVSDTGLGISDAFLPFAFDAFRQEETGHDRSHEGSGLGLTVVQRLVGLLGGHVEIESEQPGGTAVTVSFPRVPAPASSRPPRTAPPRWAGVLARATPGDAPSDDGPGEGPSPDPPPDARPAAAPAPATAPPAALATEGSRADLLGTPFDFTFLTAPAAAVPPPPAPPDSPAMFDFRFGRSAAPGSPPPDPAPSKATQDEAEPSGSAPTGGAAAPESRPAPPPFAPRPSAPTSAPAATAPPAFQTVPPAFQTAPPPAADPQPVAPPAASFAAPADADPVMIVRAQPGAAAPPAPGATPALPAQPAAADAGDDRPPVLVVEDNDDTRMLLDRILRSVYNVTAVGDARSALLAMNERRFAGLVLDINLGGKETGADVLRIARSLPTYGGVFAIALTAYALPGDRERLLESGFDEYISKPFTRQSLMDALAAGVQA